MSSKYKVTIKVREMRAPMHEFDVPFRMDLTEERWMDGPGLALAKTYAAARLVCSSDAGTEAMIEELQKQGYVFAGGDRRPPRGYFVFAAELGDQEGFFFTTPMDNDLEEFCDRVDAAEEGSREPCYETYEEACVAAWTHADELWLGAPPDLPAIPKYPQLPRGYYASIQGTGETEDGSEVYLWECAGPEDESFGEYQGFWDGAELHRVILAEMKRREARG